MLDIVTLHSLLRQLKDKYPSVVQHVVRTDIDLCYCVMVLSQPDTLNVGEFSLLQHRRGAISALLPLSEL